MVVLLGGWDLSVFLSGSWSLKTASEFLKHYYCYLKSNDEINVGYIFFFCTLEIVLVTGRGNEVICKTDRTVYAHSECYIIVRYYYCCCYFLVCLKL